MSRRGLLVAVAVCASLAVSRAVGAPPTVKSLFPAGAKRGAVTEIQAVGTFEKWPPQVWTSDKSLTFEPGKKSGKFTVRVDADAAPGPRFVRFIDESGSSAARVFFVGAVDETKEAEPNEAIATAQRIEQPAVLVNGSLGKNDDVDCYRVSAKAGTTLVASMDALAAFGSPIDGVLQLTDAAGYVLMQSQDERGFDPQIAYAVERDGEYVVRVFGLASVPNSSIRFSGSEDAIYRLTLTTGPFVERAWPAAVQVGNSAEVEPRGFNLPAQPAMKIEAVKSDAFRVPLPHAFAGWGTFAAVDRPTLVEDAKRDPKKPIKLSPPVAVSGVLATPGEQDAYVVEGKKGHSLRIRVAARGMNSAVDPVVRVVKSDGTLLIRLDDIVRGDLDVDGVASFTADGDYQLIVEDLNGAGGPRFVYLLEVRPAAADFGISAASAELTGTIGKPMEIPISVDRPKGQVAEIAVRLEGLADVGEVKAVSANKGAEAKKVSLKFTPTKPFSGPIQIVGTITGETEVRRLATAPVAGIAGERIDALWLTVTNEAKPTTAKQ